MEQHEIHLASHSSGTKLLPTADNGGVSNGIVHRLHFRDGRAGEQSQEGSVRRQRKPCFSQFATTESGIHGMAIVGNPKTNRFRRAIWLLLILNSCGLLIWALVDRVQKYREYDFSTQVTLKYEQQLLFPAVTICNFNPFLQSKVNGTVAKAVLSLLRPKLSTESGSDFDRLASLAQKKAPPKRPGGEGGESPDKGRESSTEPNPRRKRSARTQVPSTTAKGTQSTTTQSIQTGRTQKSTQRATTQGQTAQKVPATLVGATQRQTMQKGRGTPSATTEVQGKGTQNGPTTQGGTQRNRGTRKGLGTVQAGPTQAPNGQKENNAPTPTKAGNSNNGPQGNGFPKWPQSLKDFTERQFFSLSDDEMNELLANVSVQEFFLENGHQIDDMLLTCTWRNQNCSASNFVQTFTSYGNCYTFNADQQLYASQAGSGNGLELLLDAQQNDYLQGIADQEAGFRILPHNKEESPAIAVDSLGFAVAPGTKSFVGIGLKKV